MQMRQAQTLILLCFMAALPLSLKATHIVGGEMTYKCLGNNQYEIKLTIFRDCFNGIPWFDDPAAIGVFDNITNEELFLLNQLVDLDQMLNDTLDPTLDDECLVVPPNVCVNTTTYTTVMTLPFRANGYHLSYQRCCRNNTIINLIAPEDVGATYNVVITEEAQLECNSSPVFNEWPPLYLCANVPFEIDQSAVDIDGDSLVYKLCNPLTGATPAAPMPQPPFLNPPPYDTVPWLPGYSMDNMINLAPNPPMTIDSETGMLTGTPTVLGQFVIGICVEEYRNGELIGLNRRDYQVNIGDCQAVIAAFANSDGNVTCGSTTVTFENNSINATEYLWTFNDPGNPGATSSAVNPTYTFTDYGVYDVQLIANPGAICADTATLEVSVQPQSLTVDFDVEIVECLENLILQATDLSTDTFTTIESWEWVVTVDTTVFTSNEQNPSFEVTPPGGAIVSLTVTNSVGCVETFEDIFPIKPPLLTLDLGPDFEDCEVGQLVLDAGAGFDAYVWDDGSMDQTLTVNEPGTYSVTVTDACGEMAEDAITIVLAGPTLDVGPDVEICLGQSHTFMATGFDMYEWSPAGSLSCSDCADPTATPDTTTTYIVVGTTADGCVSSDTVTVTVLSNIMTSENIDICEGDTAVVFGNSVTMSGMFSETFMSQNGCDSTHTITVGVLPNIETSEEIGICDGETVTVFGNPVDTAGVFSETFTAQNGCDSTHTITVTVFPTYHIIEDLLICEGDTAFVFGNPVTMPGEFSDTLETVNGCDSILTVGVGVIPTTTTSETISICFGETTDIFGTQTGVPGDYEMTFTGADGCDSIHTITLMVYDEITVQFQTEDASCFGLADGSATATAMGGNGGFTYEWSNGDIGQLATDLLAGDHTVTVTDATNCMVTATVTINEPPELIVEATGVNVSCTELGSVSASASGGTGDYIYLWSTGDSTASVDNLTAGVYVVLAADENNCVAIDSVEITGALAPTISINVDQQPTANDPESGQLSVDIVGGMMPYNIEWSNGDTNDSLFNLPSGEYIVTVTDANGCEVMDTAYLFISACTGGRIWKDANRNGCQDPGEVGIPNVSMSLLGTDIWGNSVTATTTSAINGEYIFEPLPPGEYLIFIDAVPTGYTLSPQDNCADDFVDSDFDMNGVATELVILTEGHCCLIIDGGLYDDCLNVFDPGEICCDQTLCGPGNYAAPITSLSPAAGANQVEYQWIYSEITSANPNGTAWNQVKDMYGNPVTTTDLNPGRVYATTLYARCVRAIGCTEWLVTDVVTITIDDEAVAIIDEPGAICVGDEVTFTAAWNEPGATYLWNFGPTATPPFSNDPAPTVVFNSSSYPAVWLTVTNNGCTSTDIMLIAVSDDPVYCGTILTAPNNNNLQNGLNTKKLGKAEFLVYPNPVNDQLTIEWGNAIESAVQVEILSMEGRMLMIDKIGENAFRYKTNLGHLNAGIYMLRVQHSDGEQEVYKLVKQ